MNQNQLKQLTKKEKDSGHKFVKHAQGCQCVLCKGGAEVCKICGGSKSETYSSLTAVCVGIELTADELDKINKGQLDHDKNGWFNPEEGPSVRDVVDYPIGTLLRSNQDVEFVVFAHYENTRGKRGIRMIETADYMQANPDVRSYIFASSMAPWFPEFAEKLTEHQEKLAEWEAKKQKS